MDSNQNIQSEKGVLNRQIRSIQTEMYASWKKNKYFQSEGSKTWIFKSPNNKLTYARDFQIKRHVMIRLKANPYLNEYQNYYKRR